jgi:hypothetical protein
MKNKKKIKKKQQINEVRESGYTAANYQFRLMEGSLDHGSGYSKYYNYVHSHIIQHIL